MSAPAREYIIGTFETVEGRPWQAVCKQPLPQGSWVFTKVRTAPPGHSGVWPSHGYHYVVLITGTSASGRSRHGDTVGCVNSMRSRLSRLLFDKVEWRRDCYGRPYAEVGLNEGSFKAQFDNGYRSNGQDEGPSIYFQPIGEGRWPEVVMRQVCEHFRFYEESLVERAAAAPRSERAAPDLGELMAQKHGR